MENQKTIINPKKIPHVPIEILEQILKHLSVKSLLRFKCVSKSWLTLISSPEFVKSHFKISSTAANFARHRITFERHYNILHQTSVHSLLYEPPGNAVLFDMPRFRSTGSVTIVDCCNGIVCFLIGCRKFILWNPSTRKFKDLPDISGNLADAYGFGYDNSNDDYKVFAAMNIFGNKVLARVYSLKSHSWKTVHYGKRKFSGCRAKFASGKLYWITYGNIEFFDLEKEVFGEVIEHPCQRYIGVPNYMSLEVFDGCIGAYYYVSRFIFAGACALRQSGAGEEYWEKVFAFPYRAPWEKGVLEFCFAANGEIILSHGPNFVVYNLRDQSFRRSFVANNGVVGVYVESLVSLDSD